MGSKRQSDYYMRFIIGVNVSRNNATCSKLILKNAVLQEKQGFLDVEIQHDFFFIPVR
jgi:hypothetical protein